MLRQQDLSELALEPAVTVSYTDPRTEDEGRTCREDHVAKIRRALEREFAEIPYLVRQLSVFDDRQLVTGLPRTIVRRPANLETRR
jgi:hypothetical protein